MRALGLVVTGLAALLGGVRAEGGPPPFGDDPTTMVTLRQSTFNDSIATGTWMVEFFSPYCPHCKVFAPTYQEFYDKMGGEKLAKERNFHIVKVDCAEDGDLCFERGVESFPQIQLYDNGAFVERYEGRTVDKLEEYAKVVMGDIEFKPSQGAGTPAPVANSEPPKIFNEDGESFSFNETTYQRMVLETKTPWLIKYFSPYCPHCMAMKSDWLKMAKQLKGKVNVGEVNCEQQREMCKAAKIQEYPSIFFQYGSTRAWYQSTDRSADAMTAFGNAAIQASEIAKVSSIGDMIESIKHPNELTLAYFYDDATVAEDFEAMRRVAIETVDIARVFRTRSEDLAKLAGVTHFPAIYAVLGYNQWVAYPGQTPKDIRDVKRIAEWVTGKWLLKVPQVQVDSVDDALAISRFNVIGLLDPSAPQLMNEELQALKAVAWNNLDREEKLIRQDLLSLRADKQDDIKKAELKDDDKAVDVAKAKKLYPKIPPSVGFMWMDAKNEANVAWLKERLRVDDLGDLRVVITDESKGLYYARDADGRFLSFNSQALLAAIDDATRQPAKLAYNSMYYSPLSYISIGWYAMLAHPLFSLVGMAIAGGIVYARRRRRRSHHDRPLLPTTEGKLD